MILSVTIRGLNGWFFTVSVEFNVWWLSVLWTVDEPAFRNGKKENIKWLQCRIYCVCVNESFLKCSRNNSYCKLINYYDGISVNDNFIKKVQCGKLLLNVYTLSHHDNLSAWNDKIFCSSTYIRCVSNWPKRDKRSTKGNALITTNNFP